MIEREGPWRRPQDFFPAYDDAVFKHHLQTMEPEVFDAASGMMVITYQTFVVRTPRYTILVDTCTGEDKGHPPPFDFPGKERWRNELFALGISFEQDRLRVLHPSAHRPYRLEHDAARRALGADLPERQIHLPQARICGLGGGEQEGHQSARHGVPRQLPADRGSRAGLLVDDDYALDDTITLTPTPGHSPCHCCVNIFSKGQRALVAGDLMHHQIQCRETDWSARPDWDPKQSAVSRRKFFASVADTDTLILPIHFPRPDGRPDQADGERLRLSIQAGLSEWQ